MLIDTNIAIDYLRNKPDAIKFIENPAIPFSISVITITELLAGVRGIDEESELFDFLSSLTIFNVSPIIAEIAGSYMKQFSKSHNVGIADALIAASASHHHVSLASLNAKHFPMVSDLVIPY
jgi:predicted nucleic acid-binding protein